jgi:hypothetical protein
MLFLAIWAPLLFLCACVRCAEHGFETWFFVAYHVLRIGPRFRFFAHANVLCHREGHCHRGFFRGVFSVFNHWLMQWWVGPFYGQVPLSYAVAHNKIHHKHENGLDDTHTNLDLDRRRLSSFIIYAVRFLLYWTGVSPLVHFITHGEVELARRFSTGIVYYTAFAGVSWRQMGPLFACAYVLYPLVESSFFLGGISYLWHVFIDPSDVSDPFISSVTIVDGHDNIWNEDYHAVHHMDASVHWSQARKHFVDNRSEYAKRKATVFSDTEEWALLYWILSGNWDELASHFVDFSGEMSRARIKQLLITRASYVAE